MSYWLHAIYEDGETRLGTFANELFEGKSIQRKLTNFRKMWKGVKDMHGNKIIGVRVERTETRYGDPVEVYDVIWQEEWAFPRTVRGYPFRP